LDREGYEDIEIKYIDVSELRPHPINSKIYIDDDPERDQQLLDSIAKHGIRQPLVVTPDKVIVSGVRRWRIAKQLGISKVPCIVREFDDVEIAIVEYNMYRKKTPREILNELNLLERKLGKKTDARKKISQLINKSEGTIAKLKFVAKHKDVTETTRKIFEEMADGKLSINKAYKLMREHLSRRGVKKLKATSAEKSLFKYYPISLVTMIPGEHSEEKYIDIAKKIIQAALDHLRFEGYTDEQIVSYAMRGVIPKHKSISGMRLEDIIPEELIARVGDNPKRIKLVLYMALENNPLLFDEIIKKLNFAFVG